ncbi:MAG: nucleoside hydrolase [Halarcobacter sp.]
MKKIKNVIIDSDMGWDDVLSICYLMKNPSINILAITVTGCGETDLKWGSIIAKTLMELGEQVDAKVSIGADKPLKFNHKFPQSFKNDMNDIMGLMGSLNPKNTIEFDKRDAWDLLYDSLENCSEKITILSLGGFTNIAKMLEKYPTAKIENIEQIYAMAGAVYVDGNVALLNNAKKQWNQGAIYSTNYSAEWNVFVDPVATKKVFDSTIPITLIPLDACNYVVLNAQYVDTITTIDPIATLVKNIFIQKTGSHDEGIPVPIFDPLATMIMAGDLQYYQFHEQYLDVNTSDTEVNNHCGKTYITPKGKRKITIVQGVSQLEFSIQFAKIINKG